MIGQLWVSLGDYYIRAGHFEKARDVYEEAMATVTTVRDFGQVRPLCVLCVHAYMCVRVSVCTLCSALSNSQTAHNTQHSVACTKLSLSLVLELLCMLYCMHRYLMLMPNLKRV